MAWQSDDGPNTAVKMSSYVLIVRRVPFATNSQTQSGSDTCLPGSAMQLTDGDACNSELFYAVKSERRLQIGSVRNLVLPTKPTVECSRHFLQELPPNTLKQT
jgi:hypothetical protein